MDQINPAIQGLVTALNERGIRTFQSCSGHEGSESHPSGHVWVEPDALSIKDAEQLSHCAGVEQVALLFGREVVPVWEIQFAGETLPEFQTAQDAILSLLQPPAASERCVGCPHSREHHKGGVCAAYVAGRETEEGIEQVMCGCRGMVAATGPGDKTPLCPVHQHLEDINKLEYETGGNNCLACSLNERAELLKLLAPFAATDGSEDSLTVLRRLADFYDTHQGENRVVVSYPVATTSRDAGAGRQDEVIKLRQVMGWICDAADAAYIDSPENKYIHDIFNIAAKVCGLTRKLPDEYVKYPE